MIRTGKNLASIFKIKNSNFDRIQNCKIRMQSTSSNFTDKDSISNKSYIVGVFTGGCFGFAFGAELFKSKYLNIIQEYKIKNEVYETKFKNDIQGLKNDININKNRILKNSEDIAYLKNRKA